MLGPSPEPKAENTPSRQQAALQIGPYRVLRILGSGAQGIVYLAERIQPRQIVALKVLHVPDERRRKVLTRYFRREQRHLAWLTHPGIVRLFDTGETDRGDPYFVMEHVDGPTLDAFCAECQPSLEDRLQIFLKICKAVAHFHHLQIVHRDLKPTNILVATEDGATNPKIVDFGLSKATHPALQSFSDPSSGVVGSWFYLAPEAVFGKKTSEASDVYSLGAILYEMLVGHPPFEDLRLASETDMVRALRNAMPPPPSKAAAQRQQALAFDADESQPSAEFSARLDKIVMRALAKEPAARYAGPNEFAEAVQALLPIRPLASIGQRSTTSTLTTPPAAVQAPGRNPSAWVYMVALILVAVAAAAALMA